MLFSPYPAELLNGIGHVSQDIEQINAHATALRTHFSALCGATEKRLGTRFSAPEGSYFQLSGHLGLVNAHLHYANEGEGTFGRVVLRKHTLDEHGRDAWPEIWAFRIMKDGDVLTSDSGPVLYNALHVDENDVTVALRPLLESIVLAAMKPR